MERNSIPLFNEKYSSEAIRITFRESLFDHKLAPQSHLTLNHVSNRASNDLSSTELPLSLTKYKHATCLYYKHGDD